MRRVIGLALVLAACTTGPDAGLVRETCERLERGNVQTAGFILTEAERQFLDEVDPRGARLGEQDKTLREDFRAALRAECPTTLIAVTQGLAGRDPG